MDSVPSDTNTYKIQVTNILKATEKKQINIYTKFLQLSGRIIVQDYTTILPYDEEITLPTINCAPNVPQNESIKKYCHDIHCSRDTKLLY